MNFKIGDKVRVLINKNDFIVGDLSEIAQVFNIGNNYLYCLPNSGGYTMTIFDENEIELYEEI